MSIQEIPNTQWKFVIIDEVGTVEGTNDPVVALEHANSSVVIDMSTCQIVDDAHHQRNIPEQELYDF